MRKHFLILMLLTLLPLSGFAQVADFGPMSLGKYTYGDGTSWPAPVVRDQESSILTAGTHYTVVDGVFTDEACTTPVTVPANMKADGTKYYRKVEGKVSTAYEGKSKTAFFTVEKAPLTVTLTANALDRTFGGDPITLTAGMFTPSGMVYGQAWNDIKNGDVPTYSTSSNNAGDYATNTPAKLLSFTGGWNPVNYTITYVGALNIAQKNIGGTATIEAFQGDVVYTGKNFTAAYTVKDGTTTLEAGKDYTVATVKNVAESPCAPTITFKGNYTGSMVPGTPFNITPAPITVSIDPITVVWNNANQQNQLANANFKYNGLVGDDVANADLVKGAFTDPTSVNVGATAKNIGDYTLTISGGSATSNYAFTTYMPGKLTIRKREIAIQALDKSKKLGESDPTNGFTIVGATDAPLGSESISGISYTREDGEAIGSYAITPNVGSAVVKISGTTVTSNYTLVPVDGTLTIGKGAIVVTINDDEKFYGEDDPTFTVMVDGLDKGDALGAYTIIRDKKGEVGGENVGNYALNATIANPNPAKYESLTVIPGILKINKAKLTFTIPAQNVAKLSTKAALSKSTIIVEGINNSDVADDLYDLDFDYTAVTNDGGAPKKVTADETVANGINAILKPSVSANYEIDALSPNYIDATHAFGKVIVGAGTLYALNFTSVDLDYADIVAHAGETQPVTLTINPRNAREVPVGTAHKWEKWTWNTIVLPFEVTVREISNALGYAIVNRVDVAKTSASNVVFKLEMDKIPANEPFLVKTDADVLDDQILNFGSKKIVAPADEYPYVDAGMGYKFVGAYKTLAVDKNKSTFNFLRGDNNSWAHIGASSANTWTVVPFDAYVDLSAAAAPDMVTFTFQELDGSTTAIKNVESSVNEVNSIKTGWYTIDGKKLNAAPAQKGIYIYNGKKYVVK